MKMLSASQQDQALLRICAVQMMINKSGMDAESFACCTEYLSDLAYVVGGIPGLSKVAGTLERYGSKEGV